MTGPRLNPAVLTAAAFGYAFLYLPIAILVLFSFNASSRLAVWEGFSLRWYAALLTDSQLLAAALRSLQIAVIAASVASLLGLMAALALVRFGPFRGRTLLAGLIGAPMVVPDVVLGLALLLFFVALASLTGWPAQRGMATITLAHAGFGVVYATVVIRARLVRFDATIEEAARDLGAPPWRVFRRVTLPLLLPALAAAWLLAFTLSLDDLVVASFVSGPGASTLPMVIFSRVRLGLSPEVNALASLLMLFVVLAVGASLALLHRRRNRGNDGTP